MSTIVIKGGSNGRIADVKDNALLANPRSDFAQAVRDGNAFSWNGDTYDYDANDTILGLENNSATKDLYIEKIFVTGSTATQFVVFAANSVTMAGTARNGVNLNRGNSSTAAGLATAKRDETGNGEQAAGYNYPLITGRYANNGIVQLDIGGAIVLGQDQMIGIDLTTDGTACSATILGYFKDKE
jgi:hypothetical protein